MKKRRQIYVITILITAIISYSIFYFFYGTPWNVLSFENKFEHYLEDKYKKSFVIDDISFNVLRGKTYHAYAHAKNEPAITFYVGQNTATLQIEDSYHYESWQMQAKEELRPLIETFFPDHFNYSIETYLTTESPIYDSAIPNYKPFTTVDVGISMNNTELTKENKDIQLENSYNLLQSLKEKGVPLQHFGISYKNKTILLQARDIHFIYSVNDLEKWVKEYR